MDVSDYYSLAQIDWWGAFKDTDDWPTTYHILVLYVCAGSPESLGAFSTQLNGEVHRFSGTNGPVIFLKKETIV